MKERTRGREREKEWRKRGERGREIEVDES
jgi:hypothetical protein